MGTQGVVSVTRNGKTLIKAVAGCNGFEAKKLARGLEKVIKDIREKYPDRTAAKWVELAARQIGFGCPDCLVVIDGQGALGKDADDLPSLYRQTFDDARFNPRWQRGTASHVEVVEIGEGGGIRTRFISQARCELLARLIKQCVKEEVGATEEGTVVYSAGRTNANGDPRVYLVFEDGEIFNPWRAIKYRPIPEEE